MLEDRLGTRGLVSCLTVTQTGRESYMQAARLDLKKQVYPSLEHVVIDHPKGSLTLGDMRNQSLKKSTGELLCQWDDDDVYHPGRILNQVQALKDKDVCFLLRETIECCCGFRTVSFKRDGGSDGFWEHSMLIRRRVVRDFHLLYPPLEMGEDTRFVTRMQLFPVSHVTLDSPEDYIYRFHGNNTVSAKHFDFILHNSGSDHSASKCLRERTQ